MNQHKFLHYSEVGKNDNIFTNKNMKCVEHLYPCSILFLQVVHSGKKKPLHSLSL